jgi:hypothetical protein
MHLINLIFFREEAKKIVESGDEKKMLGFYQTCNVTIQYLSSFFDTIDQFLNLETEAIVEKRVLELVKSVTGQLNTHLDTIIRAQLYCTSAYVSFTLIPLNSTFRPN